MYVLKILFCCTKEIPVLEDIEYNESSSSELDPDGMLFTDNIQLCLWYILSYLAIQWLTDEIESLNYFKLTSMCAYVRVCTCMCVCVFVCVC